MIFWDVATKPTLSQLAEVRQAEHLWDWLGNLPDSFEAEIMLGLILAAFAGSVVSWLAKWSQGEANNLWAYTFKNNLKRTVAAVLSTLGVLIGLVTSGIFVTDADAFVGWAIVMINGFAVGFGSDSAINKGKRVEWTAEKRKPSPTQGVV